MKINKKIILFTYDYPKGDSENTFIEFELSSLLDNFKNIEIIHQKNFKYNNKKIKNKKLSINSGLSKQFNITNIILNFLSYTLFSINFYNEIKNILFKKKFFLKLKMSIMELTQSQIAYKWIKKNKFYNNNNVIFYSFWSNFILLSFERLKKKDTNLKTISRVHGSDLNGYIKKDDYVPYIKKKFYSLSKLFISAKFQEKKLLKKNLINKNNTKIAPLGVYKVKHKNYKINFNSINFLSCNNFIEIKNNLLMIEFIKTFSTQTKNKISYYVIGDGKEKNKIKSKLNEYKKYFNFRLIKKVDNLPKFLKKNNIHFFMNFSSQEGMSFSIMEAMSCGIPTISSNIEANKSLVDNTRGYLIDLNNLRNSFLLVSKKISKDLREKKSYISKKSKSRKFINQNLINKNCYSQFFNELKKI